MSAHSVGRHAQTGPSASGTAPGSGSRTGVLVRRLALILLAVGAVATVAGLVLLWPGKVETPAAAGVAFGQGATTSESARVMSTEVGPCGSSDAGRVLPGPPLAPLNPGPQCPRSILALDSGPDSGKQVLLEILPGPGAPDLRAGDQVHLGRATSSLGQSLYTFEDFRRGVPVLVWIVIAVLALVAVGAWKGLRAALGIGVALGIVVGFVLPALLSGRPATLVALVGGAAVLYPVMYLVHGINLKTHAALLGTLCATLAATGLSVLAVLTCRLTGLGEESTSQVQAYLQGVSIPGLLLAGFIIGVLGVLNDVTIAQSATVFQMRHLDPGTGLRSVFRAAMGVGRDHIASVTYTLVLAYAGSALPMLILFHAGGRPLWTILTSDVVAVEVLRSIVGVLALALAVPLTTGAALLLSGGASAEELELAAEGGHAH